MRLCLWVLGPTTGLFPTLILLPQSQAADMLNAERNAKLGLCFGPRVGARVPQEPSHRGGGGWEGVVLSARERTGSHSPAHCCEAAEGLTVGGGRERGRESRGVMRSSEHTEGGLQQMPPHPGVCIASLHLPRREWKAARRGERGMRDKEQRKKGKAELGDRSDGFCEAESVHRGKGA